MAHAIMVKHSTHSSCFHMRFNINKECADNMLVGGFINRSISEQLSLRFQVQTHSSSSTITLLHYSSIIAGPLKDNILGQ